MRDCIAAWGRLKSVLQYNYCIAGKSRLGIVLQESVLQHNDIGCSCIAIQWDGWVGSVLQYTGLYCRLGGVVLQKRGLFVSQYKQTIL